MRDKPGKIRHPLSVILQWFVYLTRWDYNRSNSWWGELHINTGKNTLEREREREHISRTSTRNSIVSSIHKSITINQHSKTKSQRQGHSKYTTNFPNNTPWQPNTTNMLEIVTAYSLTRHPWINFTDELSLLKETCYLQVLTYPVSEEKSIINFLVFGILTRKSKFSNEVLARLSVGTLDVRLLLTITLKNRIIST